MCFIIENRRPVILRVKLALRRTLRYYVKAVKQFQSIIGIALICAAGCAHTPVQRRPQAAPAIRTVKITTLVNASTKVSGDREANALDKSDRVPRVPHRLRVWTEEERKRINVVQRHVKRAAKKHKIGASLINGIIWVESKFEVFARGPEGPRGLMQLMPRTSRAIARELRLKHRPYAPSFNVDAGSYYFAKLLKQFDGRVEVALAAYKMGPASIKALLDRGEPIPGSSQRYAQRVLVAANAFEKRLGLKPWTSISAEYRSEDSERLEVERKDAD
jgi:hypothetical protein